MGKANFTEDFKRDAVHQLTERGYSMAVIGAQSRHRALADLAAAFGHWRKLSTLRLPDD